MVKHPKASDLSKMMRRKQKWPEVSPTGPYTAVSALELVENRRVISSEVFVDDDVDSRILCVLGHRHRPATQYRDLCNILHPDHSVQHPRPY